MISLPTKSPDRLGAAGKARGGGGGLGVDVLLVALPPGCHDDSDYQDGVQLLQVRLVWFVAFTSAARLARRSLPGPGDGASARVLPPTPASSCFLKPRMGFTYELTYKLTPDSASGLVFHRFQFRLTFQEEPWDAAVPRLV